MNEGAHMTAEKPAKVFAAPAFELHSALNGYIVQTRGGGEFFPPVVVEMLAHTEDEFEKVLDALMDGYRKIQARNK